MPLFVTNNSLLPAGSRRTFFVTLFFVTVASFLFWLDTYRGYEAEVRLLIIGKSPSVSTDQVIENFSELTSNLSFYERVLAQNDLIDDAFEGYTKDKRKELWNETVIVKRSEKSGVLVVTAKQKTSEEAKRLAEETVKTLFLVAGFYYNIKTDLEMRVVDETILTSILRQPIQYLFVSFGTALGVTIAFFGTLTLIPFLFWKRKSLSKRGARPAVSPEFALGASVPYIDPQKFVPARPENLTFESSHQARRDGLSSREAPLETSQNERMLPGMDMESLPFQFEETYPDEPTDTMEHMKEKPDVAHEAASPSTVMPVASTTHVATPAPRDEPTIEEYKRRLNELLAGGK